MNSQGYKAPPRLFLWRALGRYFIVLVVLLSSLNPVAAQEEKPVVYSLCIKQGEHTVAELPLPLQGNFIVTYVHSIHKRPVYEYYRANKGMLQLYELRYDTTSTGMPSDAEGGFRLEDGFFVLTMDRKFPALPLFVSPIPGHGVIIEGHLYLFTEWVREETALELSVTERTQAKIATSP